VEINQKILFRPFPGKLSTFDDLEEPQDTERQWLLYSLEGEAEDDMRDEAEAVMTLGN
jgi:hypothetical protein